MSDPKTSDSTVSGPKAPVATAVDASASRPVIRPLAALKVGAPKETDKTLCERCGADMYRMHAVWRCPSCGFKTDCCGW